MVTLKNDKLTVTIKTAGAELTSIKSNANQLEYLWQGGDIWNRHAPLLFPIVGRLENNTYTIGKDEFQMSQHGFARDMEFEDETESDTVASFVLRSDTETLEKFPFKFELRCIYILKGNQLTVRREVFNIDNKTILFSIGEHPGFNCPWKTGEKYEDYYLEFSQKETAGIVVLDEGLQTDKTTPYLKNESVIPLTKTLFDKDALVFKNLKSTSISLKNKVNKHSITMDFKGYPFLGIWSKPGTDKFVCLEPWQGIADTKGKNSEFKNKEGIIQLDPFMEFACQYTLTIA